MVLSHAVYVKTGHAVYAKTGHAVYAKTGHAGYAKTGCTVGIYTPKGFVKILMRDVEGEGRGVRGLAEAARLRGRGDRRRRGHLDREEVTPVSNTYIHSHTRYPHPPFTLQ